MTGILGIFICNFIAAELVKGTYIGMRYRRKDYFYYNFLSNLITNPIIIILTFIFLLLIIMAEIVAAIIVLIILVTTITVIETKIYMNLLKFSKTRGICTSIITNIFTSIVFILLFIAYSQLKF